MRKITLGKNKTQIRVMNAEEYKKFLSNKTVYHHNIFWVQKWNSGIRDLLRYFPSDGFTLPQHVKLKRYRGGKGYSSKCLGWKSTTGKNAWEYVRYKVRIHHAKSGTLYYVTKLSKR